MSIWAWWFIASFALLIAELMIGTFYLSVIAVAGAAAGLVSLAGMPFAVQLIVAAGIGLAGSLWLRNSRFSRSFARSRDAAFQNLDIGQAIYVPRWSAQRTARAPYRGAEWDVELAAGEEAQPGEYIIRDVRGSRLIVARRA
jgi:membrane protein implicated in regulation of membrane protease activity